jgi:hypothetical protein
MRSVSGRLHELSKVGLEIGVPCDEHPTNRPLGPTTRLGRFSMPAIQAAASSFTVQVRAAPDHVKDEIESVFPDQARDSESSLMVM